MNPTSRDSHPGSWGGLRAGVSDDLKSDAVQWRAGTEIQILLIPPRRLQRSSLLAPLGHLASAGQTSTLTIRRTRHHGVAQSGQNKRALYHVRKRWRLVAAGSKQPSQKRSRPGARQRFFVLPRRPPFGSAEREAQKAALLLLLPALIVGETPKAEPTLPLSTERPPRREGMARRGLVVKALRCTSLGTRLFFPNSAWRCPDSTILFPPSCKGS